MGVGYCKPNCIHFDDWSCNKKPKFFFGLFRHSCYEVISGHQPCPLIEPHPRPRPSILPSGGGGIYYPPESNKPNVCDVCGRILEKDW